MLEISTIGLISQRTYFMLMARMRRGFRFSVDGSREVKCCRFSRLSRSVLCTLYRIDTDLTLTRVLNGISVSNGIAWSPDETVLYYVDTRQRGIDRFDYDLATGTISNRSRFVDVDRADGLPDGITVDEEGHIWLALYRGNEVRRYAPDGSLVAKVIYRFRELQVAHLAARD